MFEAKSKKIKFSKVTATTWTAPAHRGFTPTITYTSGISNPYGLSVSPSGYTAATKSFKLAKDAFRLYLHTKPVSG